MATVLCPINIPPGFHHVTLVVNYAHESPTQHGKEYVYYNYSNQFGGVGEIEAEGHPYKIVASIIDGHEYEVAKCYYNNGGDEIFSDGFESKDTRYWK
jgi:hypothetical protein